MGRMVEGIWREEGYDTASTGGRFVRSETSFRNWITPDGATGPTGDGGFPAAAGRYQLYVALACPWAHRTLIMRKLKGLEGLIDVAEVHGHLGGQGWSFERSDGGTGDPLYGLDYLHQLYAKAAPRYTGRVTVPVLWDKERATIVSNESAEIIRMFNGAFDKLGATGPDFYPEPLRAAIDAINQTVFEQVNNGVYKAGFATTQAAYDEAVTALFETLDALEVLLGRQRYLVGDQLTEADLRLATTLFRFDAVYVGHFKCNLRRLVDYPNLWAYARELYQLPGVAETTDLERIKRHYYASLRNINPTGIVPKGPILDWTEPHGRG
jgi:putative glutathione S-transferase